MFDIQNNTDKLISICDNRNSVTHSMSCYNIFAEKYI